MRDSGLLRRRSDGGCRLDVEAELGGIDYLKLNGRKASKDIGRRRS